jgi:hypothetical protein
MQWKRGAKRRSDVQQSLQDQSFSGPQNLSSRLSPLSCLGRRPPGVGSTSARGVESTPGDSTSQLTLGRSPTRGGAADAWDKFENLSGPRCLAYPPALGRGRILPCRCGRVDKRSSRIGWKPLPRGPSPPPFQIAPFGASRRPIREGIMTRELSVRRRLLCPGLLPENRRT